MKRLLILPLMFATMAYAETTQVATKVACADDKSIIEGLASLKEQPIAVGKSSDGEITVIVTMNAGNKDWTIVALNKNSTCILAAGKNLKTITPTPKNNALM